jgi:hypothetical protein
LAHSCHPYNAELAEHALARGRTLHSVQAVPSAGAVFNAVTALLGWRTARRLQVLSGQP